MNKTPSPCDLREILLQYVSKDRLSHILSAERTAMELAEIFFPIYNENRYCDMQISALLHDITKEKDFSYHKSVCEKFEYSLSDSDILSPPAMHAISGAYVAKSVFFANENVFSAIRYHTTGKADMNIFEKIMFLADYIEPERTHSSCIKVREFFFSQIAKAKNDTEKIKVLDMAIVMSADNTIAHLCVQNKYIHPMTVEARNFILRSYTL